MTSETSSLLLRGKVVQCDGTAPERYLLIEGGRIVSISRRRPPASGNALYIETRGEDWIFPGLLDLHTHASYNILPLWNPPKRPYANRFEWRADPHYKNDIKGMKAHLESCGDHRREICTFAELQAIAGGTTTLQELHSLEEEEPDLSEPLLCRSTANPTDLDLPEGCHIFSIGDLLRPDEKGQPTDQWTMERYLEDREARRLSATLVHLAEGRSGFGSYDGPDPYTRQEFETFMAHPAFADPEKVRSSPFSIVHGCGIDPDDPRHRTFLRDRGISVIWSPVSNLLLYQQTLDVEKLLDAGIRVALGSDWSPSGSKHVWDEAKFARFYFEAIGSSVSDLQVFEMATSSAARCLGTESLGRLVPGALADLFILGSPLESDQALEVFFKTRDQHVRAVLVRGVPIYGDRELLERFDLNLQDLPAREGSAVAGKAVHLPPDLTCHTGEPLNVDRDITHLEDRMKAAPKHLPQQGRSNLLASSDGPYGRRMIELRQETIGYGGQVQEWRRKR